MNRRPREDVLVRRTVVVEAIPSEIGRAHV